MDNLIISNKSLTHFFYKSLSELNKKSICPLPEEIILYSSETLDRYSSSESFFELRSGRVSEKILGLNILEVNARDLSEKKLVYKDVADTLLVKLGFFSESCNDKLVTKSYYTELGKMAYNRLESFDCNFYEIPHFYKKLSTSFEHLIKLLSSLSSFSEEGSFERYLLKNSENSSLFSFSSQETKAS